MRTIKQLENLKLGRVKGLIKKGAGFKKSHIPWNKEKKGIHLSPSSEWKKGELHGVQFEKGQTPWNKGLTQPRESKYRILHQGKYWLVVCPNHPFADRKGYVREHRLIMEKFLGRILDREELVHHINMDTLDNNIENLMVISRGEHARLHHNLKKQW